MAILTPGLELDEELHAYTLGGDPVPSVTQVIQRAGLVDTRFYSDAARDRGRAVHAAAHFLAEGDLDPESVHPDLQGYLDAAERFRAETGITPYLMEGSLGHPDLRYAGTFDLIGLRANGEIVLADYKTGGSHPTHAVQLAAYLELVRANRRALALTREDIARMLCAAVYIQPGGGYRVWTISEAQRRAGWNQFAKALVTQSTQSTTEEIA